MQDMNLCYPEDPEERYRMILEQARALTGGERCVVPNLSNVSALLYGALDRVNWAGFYLMEGDKLVLGPFQGKTACIRIPLGRGVCGVAARDGQTQRVEDVHRFPGHIACDGASRSEIVIPLRCAGKVVGVMDLDSPCVGRFGACDQAGLEAVARLLEEACDWEQFHL